MNKDAEINSTMNERAGRNTSNSTIRSEIASQCWLQEHETLRGEIGLHIVSMRHMIVFQITTLGVITGLVLANPAELVLLLLIIPISSFIIGSLVYFHIHGVFVMSQYINCKIAPRLRDITGDSDVLGWETFAEEQRWKVTKLERWVTMPGIMVVIFSVPSIAALIFTVSHLIKSQDTVVALWILWVVGVLLSLALGLGFVKELKSLIWGESTEEPQQRRFFIWLKKALLRKSKF